MTLRGASIYNVVIGVEGTDDACDTARVQVKDEPSSSTGETGGYGNKQEAASSMGENVRDLMDHSTEDMAQGCKWQSLMR
jgi:hypothetical protein